MYVQRLRQTVIEVYNHHYKFITILDLFILKILFNKADQFTITRCVKPLEQPSINTITYVCNSFTYQSAKEWILLGRVFKEALIVEDFKLMIRTWNGKQCNCSFCYTCVLQRM